MPAAGMNNFGMVFGWWWACFVGSSCCVCLCMFVCDLSVLALQKSNVWLIWKSKKETRPTHTINEETLALIQIIGDDNPIIRDWWLCGLLTAFLDSSTFVVGMLDVCSLAPISSFNVCLFGAHVVDYAIALWNEMGFEVYHSLLAIWLRWSCANRKVEAKRPKVTVCHHERRWRWSAKCCKVVVFPTYLIIYLTCVNKLHCFLNDSL